MKKRAQITKSMIATLRRHGACDDGLRRLARFKYIESALAKLPGDDVAWLCCSTRSEDCFCSDSTPMDVRVRAVGALKRMREERRPWLTQGPRVEVISLKARKVAT